MQNGPVHWRMKVVLFFALATNVTGQSFLFVVLPPLGRQMGFTDIETGALLSISALLLIMAAPVWGYASEHLGRRPVILTALAGAGLGAGAFSLITAGRLQNALGVTAALGLFFTTRAIQALFVGGLLPSVQACMADITTPQQRIGGMGLIGSAYGVGAIGGATLAWLAGNSDPALMFFVSAILIAFGFTLVLLLKCEPRPHAPAPANEYFPLARIWPFVIITLIAFSAYSIVQQVVALRLQDNFGFSSDESIAKAGIGLLITALTMIVVQGMVVRVIAVTPELLLTTGALIAAISMTLCALARSYGELCAVLIVFGSALGLLLPANLTSLSLRAGIDAQGKAAGFNMMGQGLGLAIGPIAGAALYQIGPFMPFAMASALLVLAATLAAWVGLSGTQAGEQERA